MEKLFDNKMLNGTTVTHIQDKYNDKKVWIIKHTRCGHYYMRQSIAGKLFGKNVRTTKRHLQDVGVI